MEITTQQELDKDTTVSKMEIVVNRGENKWRKMFFILRHYFTLQTLKLPFNSQLSTLNFENHP